MINQKQLQELIEKIIISENIRKMYQEKRRRKMVNYYDGKIRGFYSALETLGYERDTVIRFIIKSTGETKYNEYCRAHRNDYTIFHDGEREKIQRKKEQEKNQKEEEKEDAQTE